MMTVLRNRTLLTVLALSALVLAAVGVHRIGMSTALLLAILMTVVSLLAILAAVAFAAPRWFQVSVGIVGAVDAGWIAYAWVYVLQVREASFLLFLFLAIQVAATIALLVIVTFLSRFLNRTPNSTAEL